MVIAVDFDGTCVTHAFPKIGEDIGAVPVLKRLVKAGHKIILYTMRSHGKEGDSLHKTKSGQLIKNDTLQEAIDWFKDKDIPLYGVNENPDQKDWTTSPKIYAQYYIDDAALGIPLIRFLGTDAPRPYVDWEIVEKLLEMEGLI